MIYFDNAATTAVSERVLEKMLPYFAESYGNPSSVYSLGQIAREAVDNAREKIAGCLNCGKNEIYFTSGGSEANNWAIKGAAMSCGGKHIITTSIEHHSVLKPCQELIRQGYAVTYLPVDSDGLVDMDAYKSAFRNDTVLVSVIYANNEIGVIQPVKEMAVIARGKGVLFHTDAVQAAGILPIDLPDIGVDMLSLSAHKFHGPKGIGLLYIRKGMKIDRLISGGGQERKRRAGTENVAGIVGMAEALALAHGNMEANQKHQSMLRDRLIEGILGPIDHVRLNGHREKRLPGNVNVSFDYIEGESLLLLLDLKGICASSGSACTSGSLNPSHVLLAIGLEHGMAHGSLRLSVCETNTMEEVEQFLTEIVPIVKRLREMSPLI